MSVNKNIFNRLKVYDSCLRSNDGCSKELIMGKLREKARAEIDRSGKAVNLNNIEVNDRQFYNDLKTIEETWQINISREKVGRVTIYKYKQPGFSIFTVPIEEDYLARLKNTLFLLQQFKGLPDLDFLNPLFEKRGDDQNGASDQQVIVEFDGNPDLIGLHHFPLLLDAIQHKKVVKINYNRSFQHLKEINFCPYFLKQHNSRWFLFGTDVKHEKSISNLALDRIKSIEQVENIAFLESAVNFDKEYFEDIIGITIPKNREILNVKLRFKPERLFFVKTKPLHNSQKLIGSDRVVRFEVMHNKELESLILYFGDDVEVLEPESLRKAIKARIEKMHKQYHPIENAGIEYFI